MFKKFLLIVMLSVAFFSGGQIVAQNTSYANVHVDNVTVVERSIVRTNGHIEVKVLFDGARHPNIFAFRQYGGVWQYGDAAGIECGQDSWKPVSSYKLANDILYVVLQYI